MIVSLAAIGVMVFTQAASFTAPFTDAFIRNDRVVVVGKDFEGTAARVLVSPDGKTLELRGTETRPATLAVRSAVTGTWSEQSGRRIEYCPADGRARVYADRASAGSEPKPE